MIQVEENDDDSDVDVVVSVPAPADKLSCFKEISFLNVV